MSRENLEVAQQLIDASPDDLAAALECLDPEVEFIPLRAKTEGTYRGHDGFERFLVDTSENFEVFEPHYDLRDLGDRVLAWGTIRLRGRGSGIEMDVPTGGIFEFRGGKITRWRDFGSKEQALEAAGLRE